MKPRFLFVLLCVSCMGWAQADIYKYKDPDGHVTYSSKPIKGATKLHLEPLPTMAPFKEGAPDFPSVDASTQHNRDDARRKILEDELSSEEKLLTEARQKLRAAEQKPEIPFGTETDRNAALLDEYLKPYQAQVTLHENNVKALKTELSQLK